MPLYNRWPNSNVINLKYLFDVDSVHSECGEGWGGTVHKNRAGLKVRD